jgi:putative ABC transport system ATP-binding protein
VAIARALVGNPQVLFAAEPTSALDTANSEVVVGLLRAIAERRGTTVIAVTHDARLARYADRIVNLRDGEVLRAVDGLAKLGAAKPAASLP